MTQILDYAFPNLALWAVFLVALLPRLAARRPGPITGLEKSVFVLILVSVPWIPLQLAQAWIPGRAPLDTTIQDQNAAVLILGGGRTLAENGLAWPSRASMRRGVVGADVARRFGLPVLISGGHVLRKDGPSEAALIAQAVGITSDVILDESATNTWSNANAAQRYAEERGWDGYILVTDGLHLRRARASLLASGVKILATIDPRPLPPPASGYQRVIPSIDGLEAWRALAYEVVASGLYAARGRFAVEDLFP